MGYQTHIGELELGRWHNVGLIAAYCFEHDLHLTSGALNQQHMVRWTFCSATELYNILAGNVTQLVLPCTILTCNSIIASSLEISHYKFDSPLRFVLTTGVQARHSEDRRQVNNMQKSLAEAEAGKVRLARLTEDRDLPQASNCNPSASLYRAVGEDRTCSAAALFFKWYWEGLPIAILLAGAKNLCGDGSSGTEGGMRHIPRKETSG